MIVKREDDLTFSDVKHDGSRGARLAWAISGADGAKNFTLRIIKVARGGATPHHAHDYEHEVYIAKGRGVAVSEGREVPIQAGEVVFVPAGETHQFRAALDQELEFVCVIPGQGPCAC